jgi:hypothetical protein
MSEFILAVKQGIDTACDEVLHELNMREQEIDDAVSQLITRKTDLTRKREVYVSLLERARREYYKAPSSDARLSGARPSDEASRLDAPEETASPSAHAVTENRVRQTRRYVTSLDVSVSRNQTEERYKAILGKIAEQVKQDADRHSEAEGSSRTAYPLSAPEGEFPKARGETYLTYRLVGGERTDFEKIRRCNEYFTQYPIRPDGGYFYPIVYVLDVERFLKVFFEEVRHIESCARRQTANWKQPETRVAMNESYRALHQLIDEILNAYSPTLQAAPDGGQARANLSLQVRIRDHRGAEKVVSIKELARKGERLFVNRAPVKFVGYLKQDINVIFPAPTLEVMNPHVLRQMRDCLAQCQYERAIEHWRRCEIRIRELGKRYESDLLSQLRAWLL